MISSFWTRTRPDEHCRCVGVGGMTVRAAEEKTLPYLSVIGGERQKGIEGVETSAVSDADIDGSSSQLNFCFASLVPSVTWKKKEEKTTVICSKFVC